MVKLYDGGVYLVNGREIVTDPAALPGKCGRNVTKEEAEQGTIAYGILKAHNKSGDMQNCSTIDSTREAADVDLPSVSSALMMLKMVVMEEGVMRVVRIKLTMASEKEE